MPKRPLKSAARLGRHGASEVWQFVKTSESAARRSMFGEVSRP